MQNKFIVSAFLSCLFSVCLSQVMLAQAPTVWNNCPERGISTNPKNPVNPIDPTKVNTFNWQQREFPLNGAVHTSIPSPFWQPLNNLAEPLRNSQDQANSEGWELITKGFGFLDNGQPSQIKENVPYYILYNKYTGIMRVFMAGASQGRPIPYNAYQISVKFAEDSHQSSLLMLANEPHAIFEKFIRGQQFASGTNFNTWDMLWVYADFPMTYDPCACNFKSRVYVELKLITKSQIRMVGLSQGTLTSVEDGKGEINQKESKWTLQNAIGAGKKASETFNSISSFTNKQLSELENAMKDDKTKLEPRTAADKQAAFNAFQKILFKNDFLKDGLKAAPYIGTAVSFLDAFFGGGKSSPQEVKLMPMAINMTTTLEGTMTTEEATRPILIDNPGGKDAGIGTSLPSEYPTYNETMGNISVLTLPKVKVKRYRVNYRFPSGNGVGLTNVTYARTYSLSNLLINDLRIAVNPASGLDMNNLDIKAALVFDFDNNNDLIRLINPNMELEVKTPSTVRYRTPYVNAYCLSEFLTGTVFRTGDSLMASNLNGFVVASPIRYLQPPKNVYLKLIANLKRLDATPTTQNILYVQTFKLDTFEEDITSTMNLNYPCANCNFPLPVPAMPTVFSYSQYAENIRFRSGSTVNLSQANLPTRYAWGSVIVEPNVTFVGNQPLTIWAPGGVFYEDGASPLPPNITVITDLNFNNMQCLDEKYPPVSQSFIQSACATTYKNQSQRWSKAEKDPITASTTINDFDNTLHTTQVVAYPNPAQNEVTMNYQISEKGAVKLVLTNAMGVVVHTVVEEANHEKGEFSVKVNTTDLPNGVYLYMLHTANGVSTGKLVITK